MGVKRRKNVTLNDPIDRSSMPFDHANLTSLPVFIRIEKPLCVVVDSVPSFRVDTYEFGMSYNTVPEGVVYGRWTLVYSA